MKAKPNHIHLVLSCIHRMRVPLLLILLTLSIEAFAATPIPNEFWVSTNATGNFYPSAAGTIDSPLDGSSQVNFDANVNGLPANSTIHILAGIYKTKGVSIKSAQKICGSGIDITVLQLPTGFTVGGSGASVIYSGASVSNSEVCDLTCDCNINNNTDTYSGVGIDGAYNAIRRVKVIHCGKFGGNSEAWGISLSNFHLSDSTGNIIEECEVSQYDGGGGISSISLAGGSGNSNGPCSISGIIRNNRVILVNNGTPVNKGGWFGIDCGGWMHDCLIEGNYLEGCDAAIPGDTGWAKNIIIANNQMLDCSYGFNGNGYWRDNITIVNNHVRILDFFNGSTNVGSYPFPCTAFYFYPANSTTTYTNITILDNTVEHVAAVTNVHWQGFVAGGNISGLLVEGNQYDSSMNYNFGWGNNSNLNIHNNYDLDGNPLPGQGTYTFNDGPFNIGNNLTVGGVISGNGSALTSLNASQLTTGTVPLASLPSSVVLNNASGVTLNGTFTGNGSGLTGLNLNKSAFTNYIPINSQGNGGGGYAYLSFTNVIGAPPSLGFSSSQDIPGANNIVFGWPGLVNAQSNCGVNVAIGNFTLQSLTNGGLDTAVGAYSLSSDLSGSYDVGVGVNTLEAATTSWNTAVGCFALDRQTTGWGNTALGFAAMQWVTNGSENVSIGGWSGTFNYSGNGNVVVGSGSGQWFNSSYNILLGCGVEVPQPDTGGQMNIGGVIFGNGLKPTDAENALAYQGNIGLFTTNLTGANFTVSGTTLLTSNVTVGGTLAVSNGVSSFLNNTLPATSVTVNSLSFVWTNTTPQNVAVYINGLKGGVGYNGSLLFVTTNAPVTVMLQPNASVSVTNYNYANGVNYNIWPTLNWHPL